MQNVSLFRMGTLSLLKITWAASGASPVNLEIDGLEAVDVKSLIEAMPRASASVPEHRFVGPHRVASDSTLADSSLVDGAIIASKSAPMEDTEDAPYAAAGALCVVAGPDGGSICWLARGSHEIGRVEASPVRLNDAEVSRHHANVTVTGQTASITDAVSTNGTWVNGVRRDDAIHLLPGQLVQMGDDLLQWVPLDPGRQVTRSADGKLDFDRSFAPSPEVPHFEGTFPQPVTPSRGMGTLIVSALLPMVLGVVLALATGQMTMLLF